MEPQNFTYDYLPFTITPGLYSRWFQYWIIHKNKQHFIEYIKATTNGAVDDNYGIDTRMGLKIAGAKIPVSTAVYIPAPNKSGMVSVSIMLIANKDDIDTLHIQSTISAKPIHRMELELPIYHEAYARAFHLDKVIYVQEDANTQVLTKFALKRCDENLCRKISEFLEFVYKNKDVYEVLCNSRYAFDSKKILLV